MEKLSNEEMKHESDHHWTRDWKPNGRVAAQMPNQKIVAKLGPSKAIVVRKFRNSEMKTFEQCEATRRMQYIFEKFRRYCSLGKSVWKKDRVTKLLFTTSLWPHFKSNCTKTKLSVVFDALASNIWFVFERVFLLGRKFQEDIFNTLPGIQFLKIGMIADVEKIHRQVELIGEHLEFDGLLWRSSTSENVHTYRQTRMTYGVQVFS